MFRFAYTNFVHLYHRGQLAIATGSFYFHIFFTKFDFLAKENK
jgi:hypothetical protein